MGYYAEVTDSNFKLIKLFHRPALDAINAYWQAELQRSYSAMTYEPSKDLAAALDMMGYTPEFNKRGDISGIVFNGKWREDEKFWAIIAPYVEDNSSLDFQGGDGSEWRLLFRSGKLFEQDAVKTWGEPYIIKTALTGSKSA